MWNDRYECIAHRRDDKSLGFLWEVWWRKTGLRKKESGIWGKREQKKEEKWEEREKDGDTKTEKRREREKTRYDQGREIEIWIKRSREKERGKDTDKGIEGWKKDNKSFPKDKVGKNEEQKIETPLCREKRDTEYKIDWAIIRGNATGSIFKKKRRKKNRNLQADKMSLIFSLKRITFDCTIFSPMGGGIDSLVGLWSYFIDPATDLDCIFNFRVVITVLPW